MDLGTIKKRLENNYYWKAQEAIDDFQTMFDNCYIYNKPVSFTSTCISLFINFIYILQGEDVVVMAQALEKMFKSKLAQMPKEEIKIEASPGKVIKKKPKPPVGTFVGGSVVPKVPTKPIASVEQQPLQLQQQQPFVQLPPSESTSTSTTKPISLSTPDVQSNLHTLISQPPAATSTPQIPTSSAPYLINPPTLNNSVPSVLSQQQPAKVKKGVKRKADTTTPTTAIGFNESIDVKVSTRGRQVNDTSYCNNFYL